MFIGVPYHEYWHGDCSQLHFYEEAHQLKERRDNRNLWMQGRYVYEAIADLSPILHAFAKEGTQAIPYLEEPFPLTREEAEEREERERIKKYNRLKAHVEQWADESNAKLKRKEGE